MGTADSLPSKPASLFQLQNEQLDCGAAHLQHPLALRRPLRAIPLVEYPGLTSVSVDYVHKHAVVFLGTSNGRLRKVRHPPPPPPARESFKKKTKKTSPRVKETHLRQELSAVKYFQCDGALERGNRSATFAQRHPDVAIKPKLGV